MRLERALDLISPGVDQVHEVRMLSCHVDIVCDEFSVMCGNVSGDVRRHALHAAVKYVERCIQATVVPKSVSKSHPQTNQFVHGAENPKTLFDRAGNLSPYLDRNLHDCAARNSERNTGYRVRNHLIDEIQKRLCLLALGLTRHSTLIRGEGGY